MHPRNRIEHRAHLIFDYLNSHRGQPYTIEELLRAVRLNDGQTTRSAIGRARNLATAAGLYLTFAVPANGFVYMVSDQADDALDPTLHMGRIKAGIRRQENRGIDFMRKKLRSGDVSEDARPAARFLVRAVTALQKAHEELELATEEAVRDLVAQRRDAR